MYPILAHTRTDAYAQGAFNVTCFPQLEGVLDAHAVLRSPAVIQVGTIALGFLGDARDMNNATLEEKRRGAAAVRKMLDSVADRYDIPVALHGDHIRDFETVKALIAEGFTSVMIDGSALPYDQNVELSRAVAAFAHASGVTVEAELGTISGVEEDVCSENSSYTNPVRVVDFLKKTQVDCIAISYGTKHGVNKGTDVKLRKEIITAAFENMLHEGLNAVIVSHGSSTVPGYVVEDINNTGGKLSGVGGIPVNELKQAIGCGVGKINIDTDMRLSITRNLRELFLSTSGNSDPVYRKISDYLGSHPSEIDFRVILHPLADLLRQYNAPVPDKYRPVLDCIRKGAQEIVAQLISVFGSTGYVNRIHPYSLAEMKQSYLHRNG